MAKAKGAMAHGRSWLCNLLMQKLSADFLYLIYHVFEKKYGPAQI
jgi:hypothetical protein